MPGADRASGTPATRPEQARPRPALGRSHVRESERGERDAVSQPVLMDAGRTGFPAYGELRVTVCLVPRT
jgi:hypothetical protein